MHAALIYSIIFGAPLLLYVLWLKFLRGRLGFLLLVPVMVCVVWWGLWPVNYLPAFKEATKVPVNDSGDPIMVGFMLLGWIYGVIGSLPVILIEAIRSYLQWGARRRAAKLTAFSRSEQ